MNNNAEYTKIILKWCDEELRQIMIGVEDNDGRKECCYLGKESENPNLLKIADVFEKIRGILRPVCGYDLENSSILSCLIGMDRGVLKGEDCDVNKGKEDKGYKEYAEKIRQIFQGVDDIPDVSKRRVEGIVADKASRWGLSDATIDIQEEAKLFGEYVVAMRRYIFDYNASIAMKGGLCNINPDALELEWYIVHNDTDKSDDKMVVLLSNADADAEYRIRGYHASSKAHVGAYQRFKSKREQRLSCGKEAEA